MTVYNEFDPFAAAWLRELVADNLIAQGTVDARDIRDIVPTELVGHRQVHLFAGIGVWSLALRLAGVPDDLEVWTASCPCQPFSSAGKGSGFADERHLWPAAFHLIRHCRPRVVMGEQVADKRALPWLDLVASDLEGEGYTFRAVDLCAAGVGAPHIRQRLYWLAESAIERHERSGTARGGRIGPADGGDDGRLGNAELPAQPRQQRQRREALCLEATDRPAGAGMDNRLGLHACNAGLLREEGSSPPAQRPGPTNGLWRDPDWLLCRDAKWRPVEPGTFPLADARAFRNRVGALRGAGNAINVAQAAAFISANINVIGGAA